MRADFDVDELPARATERATGRTERVFDGTGTCFWSCKTLLSTADAAPSCRGLTRITDFWLIIEVTSDTGMHGGTRGRRGQSFLRQARRETRSSRARHASESRRPAKPKGETLARHGGTSGDGGGPRPVGRPRGGLSGALEAGHAGGGGRPGRLPRTLGIGNSVTSRGTQK